MLTQNETAVAVLVVFILVQLALVIMGKILGKLAMVVTVFNILVAICIIGYWLLQQFRSTVHYLEFREVAVLAVEVLIIASACYSLIIQHPHQLFKVAQQVFFGIHLLCSILLLIFMLTFRINKLF